MWFKRLWYDFGRKKTGNNHQRFLKRLFVQIVSQSIFTTNKKGKKDCLIFWTELGGIRFTIPILSKRRKMFTQRPPCLGWEELIDKIYLPDARKYIIMNKLERRKYREIAEDMGISIKTVENQMSKALRIIRENASVLLF